MWRIAGRKVLPSALTTNSVRSGAPLGPAIRRSEIVMSGRRSINAAPPAARTAGRSEEHTSELQSLMRISYAVFCLKKKKKNTYNTQTAQDKTTTYELQHTKHTQHDPQY